MTRSQSPCCFLHAGVQLSNAAASAAVAAAAAAAPATTTVSLREWLCRLLHRPNSRLIPTQHTKRRAVGASAPWLLLSEQLGCVAGGLTTVPSLAGPLRIIPISQMLVAITSG